MAHLKLFICVALLAAVNASKKEKFYYETEYSETHKKSTSVVVGKYQDLKDFSFSSFVKFHKNCKGKQTLFSHYDSEKKSVFAVVIDHSKKKLCLVAGKETKEIDYEVKKEEWSHFALTRSSEDGNFIVYVGGKKVSTIQNFAKSYVLSSKGSLAIAQYQTDKRQYKEEERFFGKVSEANFYEKVLTESQVTKISQYQELEESEAKAAISWSKSFGQDGQTQIGPSSVPGYAKTCKKETIIVTKSQKSSSSESDSDSSESSSSKNGDSSGSGSNSQESGSSSTTTKQVCTLKYDVVFSEEASEAVAEPQNVQIKSDLEKFSTSTYSYVEDTSKESTFISYASDKEEESFSLGQKGGRFLLRVGKQEHYLQEQKTVVKSKEWASYGLAWKSETGEAIVYQNGEKIGVIQNVQKGKKFSKSGSFAVGQRQITKQKYEKESKLCGRVSRIYVIQDELTEQDFKKMSSKTESFSTKKTTLVTTSTSYSYSGLAQFTETTLTKSSSSSSGSSSDSSSDSSSSEENGDDGGPNDGHGPGLPIPFPGKNHGLGDNGNHGLGDNGNHGLGDNGNHGLGDNGNHGLGDNGNHGPGGKNGGSGEKGGKHGGSGEKGGKKGGSGEKGGKKGGSGEKGGKKGGSGEKGGKKGGSGEKGGKGKREAKRSWFSMFSE